MQYAARLLFLLAIGLMTGCFGHPDREALHELMAAYAENVLSKHRPHLDRYERPEKSIRWFAEYHGDGKRVLENFLKSSPELSSESEQVVRAMKNAEESLEKMHNDLILEKRFELTEAESTQRGKWQAETVNYLGYIETIAHQK